MPLICSYSSLLCVDSDSEEDDSSGMATPRMKFMAFCKQKARAPKNRVSTSDSDEDDDGDDDDYNDDFDEEEELELLGSFVVSSNEDCDGEETGGEEGEEMDGEEPEIDSASRGVDFLDDEAMEDNNMEEEGDISDFIDDDDDEEEEEEEGESDKSDGEEDERCVTLGASGRDFVVDEAEDEVEFLAKRRRKKKGRGMMVDDSESDTGSVCIGGRSGKVGVPRPTQPRKQRNLHRVIYSNHPLPTSTSANNDDGASSSGDGAEAIGELS